jgi:polysaccharide export outer membrane protein
MKKIVTALLASLLAACSIAPGPYLDTKRMNDDLNARPDTTVYPVNLVTADLIAKQNSEMPAPMNLPTVNAKEQYDYHVGPQDLLTITIWGHPELSNGAAPLLVGVAAGGGGAAGGLAPPATGATTVDTGGTRVSADGTIFFPYLGRVRVAGETTEQIRAKLTSLLAKNIQSPQVDVRVSGYRSQVVQVTGELKTPGTLPITEVPLSLVDAIARSGGTMPDADLQRVRLTRNGKTMVLSADAILNSGDMTQNLRLQGGDIINIPDQNDSRVFVIGEVVKPTTLMMTRGRLTIADALTSASSMAPESADPRQIYVIRGAKDDPTHPTIYRVDMTQIDAILLTTQFQLKPLDVVYVGTASAVRFNRILNQIAPTIQTLFYTTQIRR